MVVLVGMQVADAEDVLEVAPTDDDPAVLGPYHHLVQRRGGAATLFGRFTSERDQLQTLGLGKARGPPAEGPFVSGSGLVPVQLPSGDHHRVLSMGVPTQGRPRQLGNGDAIEVGLQWVSHLQLFLSRGLDHLANPDDVRYTTNDHPTRFTTGM